MSDPTVVVEPVIAPVPAPVAVPEATKTTFMEVVPTADAKVASDMKIDDNIVMTEKKPMELEETPYMSTQEEGSKLAASIINMMNTIIGAGTISLPNTIMISGIGGGAIMIVLSLNLSLIGAHY